MGLLQDPGEVRWGSWSRHSPDRREYPEIISWGQSRGEGGVGVVALSSSFYGRTEGVWRSSGRL